MSAAHSAVGEIATPVWIRFDPEWLRAPVTIAAT
jgi:hypothetical protein